MSAMTASERRQQIARLLSASQAPISATTLSQELGVSRQIIVGDIALLRAAGQEITATARGYVIPAQNGLLRRIACIHSAEETRDELDAMVDCGCTVWTSSWSTRSTGSLPLPCTCPAVWTWISS